MSAPAPATTNHGEGSNEQDSHQQTEEQAIRDAHSQKYEEGTENAHSLLDTKDERSIKNTLAAAEKKEKEEAEREARPEPLPTAAAKAHGNEPSRGAKIDEQIMIEEELELARKDAAAAQAKADAH